MRDIKFKIWDKKNKRWYIQYPNCNNLFNVYKDGTLGRKSEDNDYIFVEYTGLKDKNGVEIYEGDIVLNDRWTVGSKGTIVEWEDAGFPVFCDGECGENPDELEIIGNIYENPELLEGR